MVVPYAPGGGSDTIGRMVGLKLGEALGESFVIDNRPGAAESMVATEIVAKSLPDGYTLILADVPHTINVSTYAHPTYDAIKDFAPVMLVGTAPQIHGRQSFVRVQLAQGTARIAARANRKNRDGHERHRQLAAHDLRAAAAAYRAHPESHSV